MKKPTKKGRQLTSDSESEDGGNYVVEGNSHLDDSDLSESR